MFDIGSLLEFGPRIVFGLLGGIFGYQGAAWWRRRIWRRGLMHQFDGLIAGYEQRLLELGSLVQSGAESDGTTPSSVSAALREMANVTDVMKELIFMAPPDIIDPVATLMLTRVVARSKQLLSASESKLAPADLELQLVMGGQILDRLEYGPAERRSWRLAWMFSRTPRGWFTKRHDWEWRVSAT